ncbi:MULTISPECIES: iron-containing alcohol dehydrogenase [unclassified Planococcus (in: firmicutes)]|uniref:iron-containing alcohol dehydrogenase n=1 Tax=Planococcus TaxID=1372 RepID=UPI000C32299A|nr:MULTISPECIES: iron-containing alcohol dehydrogenase [unclassified Planococcus (in: firmicutes)]AUD13535.1 NADH-dependent alcohol dehydrogenase [Planococcus sp. MB-3u-03]PKG46037.1 NADH-dependent alcohol dehydrogenase [Planococcus sp. Urea-trap-24]PKG89974.1 NADH-dependent alcohol dehydrogenase [Planococcus sp. Urea-3u-39]PKH40595.1 NADH-dependent alcohol dehydrogenase [Planococcus sp. MB-3u-09]
MNAFSFYNPVKLIFGKGQLEALKNEVPNYGKKVLVVYGGGSIKKNGLYDEVMAKLNEMGVEIHELSGVEPNPRLSTAKRGIEICKKENIDMLLAVGGGSVIDCTKLIAAGAKYDGDAWDFVTRKATPEEVLPFGTVLTLAATGSEMNAGSVITNEETEEKYGWGSPLTFPKFSILDPSYTKSVPRDHTVYGVVDMMSHMFEQYYHNATNTPVQDQMIEGVLRAVIDTAPKLMEDLESYEHRETILFAGTMGLNNFLQMGYNGDWASHNIEHAVSAIYDIPHAGGLAILFPQWMRHNVPVNPSRFAQMAVRVFGVDAANKSEEEIANEGIDRLVEFWTSIGAPSSLKDYDIDDSRFSDIVDKTLVYGEFGNFNKLNGEDVEKILQASL